ncbi:putative glycolipid-binding domain-containing protein [Sulfobacillus thermosulfidooxidans]|uniref:putative glycolipid-binding domain-containing protein n=1 Tax=Sulfobacillus thermosulfidooxidans TaxID=28034 RepID=UPI0006B68193|nr:putative glycolipid-binding domain-containing protein [Sulfobacillus thermosulfidooxidans]
MTHIFWRHTQGQSLEYCRFTFEPHTTISGTIIGDLQGLRGALTYTVQCRPDGSTHWVQFRILSEREDRSGTLRRGENGSWLVNDTVDPRLMPCHDVDIGVTPSTNTLPIRRLRLDVGASQELSAVWIRFPDLTVHPLVQRYTRMAPNLYRYESLTSGFQVTLQVDRHGIVQDYPGLWCRVWDTEGSL